MHGWGDVASDAFDAIFRSAEEATRPYCSGSSFETRQTEQGLSNEARANRS
jgi:hypothetical protein